MWRKKRGRPPSPALDLRPAFPVIKLAIGLYLPNVGLMLVQCRRRWTNNKVTLGECLRYYRQCKMHIGRRNQMQPRTIIRVVVNSHIFGSIPAFIFFL